MSPVDWLVQQAINVSSGPADDEDSDCKGNDGRSDSPPATVGGAQVAESIMGQLCQQDKRVQYMMQKYV